MNLYEMKIIKQIERICEKQYRKGFQQGFYACKNKELSEKQVDEFRSKGIADNYSKVIQPHTGIKEIAKDRLLTEMAMPEMIEIHNLFNNICTK
tara:strand:- start:226 stop:507 length:282 start_codon:yes stop_codon:yes gene_type:complete